MKDYLLHARGRSGSVWGGLKTLSANTGEMEVILEIEMFGNWSVQRCGAAGRGEEHKYYSLICKEKTVVIFCRVERMVGSKGKTPKSALVYSHNPPNPTASFTSNFFKKPSSNLSISSSPPLHPPFLFPNPLHFWRGGGGYACKWAPGDNGERRGIMGTVVGNKEWVPGERAEGGGLLFGLRWLIKWGEVGRVVVEGVPSWW